jgi:cell division protein FtsL
MAMTAVGIEHGDMFLYDGVAAGREVRAGLARRSAAVRPLPMENLCFFVKPIDNSRLVRVMDPHSKWDLLKMLAGGLFVFVIAFGYIVPYLWMLRTGYRIEELKKEHETLVDQSRVLQVEESGLRNPRRIDEIARTRLGMSKPAPHQVMWADGANAPSQPTDLLAQNVSRFVVEGR